MRRKVLFAVPLAVGLMSSAPLSAQRVTYRTPSPEAGLLAPLISDSLSSRLRALGLLLSPSLLTDRVGFVETRPGGLECPMPILSPDSAKRFAGLPSEPLRSGDRMPTHASSCTNPLDKIRQRP